MKTFLFSSLVILGSIFLSSAFPTASNVALLARRGGLDVPEGLSLDEIISLVKRNQYKKRLLVAQLDKPIDGMIVMSMMEGEADGYKSAAYTHGKPQISPRGHNEVPVPD